jgi:quercetin dioxygenase-like cupin family protein
LYWRRCLRKALMTLPIDERRLDTGRKVMASDARLRRDVLQALAALPLLASAARPAQAAGQGEPVKVDTEGLVAKIKFEAPVAGFLDDINGKYKLRVTELTLAPGGHVGEHNHVGPGIRQVTSGYMTYVLPDKTVVYGPGDFFFEAGDVATPCSTRPMRPWCTSSLRSFRST